MHIRIVHVHFDDLHFTFTSRQLLDNREHSLARTTPWSPEVDKDRHIGLEDFGVERCIGDWVAIRG